MTITDKYFEDLKINYSTYLSNLETLHNDFGGPSIYFHQQALIECNQNWLSARHIEMIYATLTAWGMHRMGQTKTKMVDFNTFNESIKSISEDLEELRLFSLEQFENEPTEILLKIQDLCFRIKVSISNSKVVGNSKALAHILPNLAPPIDRQYSIRFFSEKLNNFKNLNEEEQFYGYILKKCYEFVHILAKDSRIKIDSQFNSSLPKIFDNLLMLHIKNLNPGI